ncbi:unnamed protein product [Soboliphyme baturini]|uniref:Ion_trans domain-containing protein n=1 Tax=Soboliphyme baturini TaxID=241478 RepID=A0A183J1S9_9BILA|nr:unnamed protein product [Soboliphyme baturini]
MDCYHRMHRAQCHVDHTAEVSLTALLGMEYIMRLWSCGCRSKYSGIRGRLQFARKCMPVIDVISLTASIVLLVTGSSNGILNETTLRGLRFVDIIRLLRIDRHGATWRLLGSVVHSHRKELLTTMYLALISLIFASYFIFIAEKDAVDSSGEVKFRTYADALWWGMVTFYTIGYGDMTPLTWIGKILTCIFCLTLTAFFQVPAGILGSGFALRVHQNQREKQQQRQIPAAATLIQVHSLARSLSVRNSIALAFG